MTTTQKIAKCLRAGDVVITDGQEYEVKRVRMSRRDWNHATIYFRYGRATTVLRTTQFTIKAI